MFQLSGFYCRFNYLNSQVAQEREPPDHKVAQNSDRVAQSYRLLAFRVIRPTNYNPNHGPVVQTHNQKEERVFGSRNENRQSDSQTRQADSQTVRQSAAQSDCLTV